MAISKGTEDQVWVVQPDHAKAFDENCVGEGWVIRPGKNATLGQIGDGISIKSIFKDIKRKIHFIELIGSLKVTSKLNGERYGQKNTKYK
ncbi:hypothetical protein [Candidatus Methylopumilus universalis]|uniref:hypothetical protein n=1 Tax=Candidatus Methylopumilus universalis TaxID=2588536 RepID=UPI003BEF0B8A